MFEPGPDSRSPHVAATREPRSDGRTPLLRLERISLSFKAIKAVNAISFEVRHHEVCALIGPNGAGKSSLLNVVSGIYRPQFGRITFAGADPGSHDAARCGGAWDRPHVSKHRHLQGHVRAGEHHGGGRPRSEVQARCTRHGKSDPHQLSLF